ncbi:MAG: sugar transferase [Cetobacterium sp.]|uniref:sugar transferase n=1 Tax=Cetobacterium sp. TaxID=2071632 RepID=UPI003F32427B
MKHGYRRYLVGMFMILCQGLLFWQMSILLDRKREVATVSFLIFIFLYLKENIYSFETCLIWEELRKQLKCLIEYVILMGIIILVFMGHRDFLKYELMGIVGFIYSFLLAKIIRVTLYEFLKTNLVIVGVGSTAKDLYEVIGNNRFTMYNFLGFIDSNKNERTLVDEELIIGDTNSSGEYMVSNKVQEVIVALPQVTNKELNNIIDNFEKFVKSIKIIPKVHKMYTFSPKIQDYDGVMLVGTKNYMMSLKRRILKRGLDIVGGVVGMIILLPLYLKYGREIKKDGGNAFFTHKRIGRNLEPFEMYKFRSMYVDAEERLKKMLDGDEKLREEFYTNFKLKDDPRVTEVGNFLRRTSLDEFPQFINVIKGEMSLVGPRPVVDKEVEMYYGTEMGQKIFQVKPGITGMWQANGRSDVEDYEERIALDLYYIRNWSLWLDIIILIKTVKNVIQKRGAY